MLSDIVPDLLNGSARYAIHTTRYSGFAVHRVESVSDHVYNAMVYSSVISHHLQREGYEINHGLVLNKTLWHDYEEPSGLGDIKRGVKHSSPELSKLLEDLGRSFVVRAASRIELSSTILRYWETAKDETIEGQIVRVADVLSVVAYLIEEHQLGNRTLTSLHCEVRAYLDVAQEKVTIPELQDLLREVVSYYVEQIEDPKLIVNVMGQNIEVRRREIGS